MIISAPLAIDLFSGLGGWTEGLLAEGYNVVGFDIERHVYGDHHYPAQLVLQDVLTLHGSQFRNAALIVASPPCQRYSYMAMPWSRAKAQAAEIRADETGGKLRELNALFEACFRIQREACEAAGRYIPMVVENVKGAQPWVGPAKAHFGSFYLWGDVAMVGTRVVAGALAFAADSVQAGRAQKFNPDGTQHGPGSWFAIADSINRGASTKNGELGGSWFPQGNGASICGNHGRDGCKVPGLNWSGSEKPGYVAKAFNDTAIAGLKINGYPDPRCNGGKGFVTGLGKGHDWRRDPSGRFNSKSVARKAASAQIAKIPFALSQYIAQVYKL